MGCLSIEGQLGLLELSVILLVSAVEECQLKRSFLCRDIWWHLLSLSSVIVILANFGFNADFSKANLLSTVT